MIQLAIIPLVLLGVCVGIVWYALKSQPLGVSWIVTAGLGSLALFLALLYPVNAGYSAGWNSRFGVAPTGYQYPVHCLALATPIVLEGRQVEGVLEIEGGQGRTWVRVPAADPPAQGGALREWDLALVPTSELTGTKVECTELQPQSGADN